MGPAPHLSKVGVRSNKFVGERGERWGRVGRGAKTDVQEGLAEESLVEESGEGKQTNVVYDSIQEPNRDPI